MKRFVFAVILLVAFATYAIQAVGQTAFKGAGVIESTSGGFKFPDGSMQLSAVTPPCTAISYLPYVILDEGVFCFESNLVTSISTGSAITIEADNVVINLNGWKLDGSGAGAGTYARGIYANHRKNITIRNGTIRGFYSGVYLNGTDPYTTSQGHLVEDIHAVNNTYAGLWIEGNGNTVRRNNVLGTGGSSSAAWVYGLRLYGPGFRVFNNDINNTTAGSGGVAYGIYIRYADGAVIGGNRVYDLSFDPDKSANGVFIANSDEVLFRGNSISSATRVSIGVYVYLSSGVLVDDNSIMNMENGIIYGGSSGKYRNNLTYNVTIPFTGGTDALGND